MIKPVVQDDAFLRDVKAAPTSDFVVHFWWLGQSGFLLKYGSRFMLIDPYLSDSLTKKYAGTDKPHVRMTKRVIPPERLDFIDVVTSSHNHTDHFDPETLTPLLQASDALKIVVPAANRDVAADRLGISPQVLIPIDTGQPIDVAGFCITGIPAAHNQLERDEQGRCRFMGYVIQAGYVTLYHSGDTVWHDEILAALHRHRIDVALLPINGDRPERRVAGNLDGAQAARLARQINARLVIPCHYDMFEFNTASPDEFERECRKIGQKYRVLQCAQRWSSTELGEAPSAK